MAKKSPCTVDFRAAVRDVRKMLASDRRKLLPLLSDITKNNPDFGIALGIEFSKDPNENIVQDLIYRTDDLCKINIDAAFSIAEALTKNQGDIGVNVNGGIISKFPALAKYKGLKYLRVNV